MTKKYGVWNLIYFILFCSSILFTKLVHANDATSTKCNYFSAHSAEEYINVIQECSEIIQKSPDNINAFQNRAMAKEELKDYLGAIEDYNKILKINPNLTIVYLNIASAMNEINDYQGAIQIYTEYLKLYPNDATVYSLRASAKSRLEDYLGSIDDLNKSINILIDKNKQGLEMVLLSMDYCSRGISKFHLNYFNEAISDFNMALSLTPNGVVAAEAYYFRGLSLIKLGNIQSGCLDLSKSGELGRENVYKAIGVFCNPSQ